MRTFTRPIAPVLSDEQWARAVAVLSDPHRGFVMPHELGNEALVGYDKAAELLRALGASGDVVLGTLVYHRCSEVPVVEIDGDAGRVSLPWTCPECEFDVLSDEAIGYGLMAMPKHAESQASATKKGT